MSDIPTWLETQHAKLEEPGRMSVTITAVIYARLLDVVEAAAHVSWVSRYYLESDPVRVAADDALHAAHARLAEGGT